MHDSNLALPHIQKLARYVPGKPIETLAREKNLPKIIKLASNENPYGPSPLVLQAIQDNVASINLYPDSDMHLLKTQLSKFYNISPEMLVIGNGSDELIRIIMQTFVNHNHNIISPRYSFFSYLTAAQAVNAEYITAEINTNWQNNLANVLQKINQQTKMICLANPNNPTGSYLEPKDIIDFIQQVPKNILILLDEAYIEYIKYSISNYTDYSIDLIKQHDNLILLRTFSKAYGLAGLRVGYSISSPQLADAINRSRLPFNVNKLAQIAACAALQDQDYIKKIIDLNNKQREILYQAFDRLKINYIPSKTNFISIHSNNSHLLYNQLLDRGIITRPLNTYGLDNYLRITIGTAEETNYLLKNLT